MNMNFLDYLQEEREKVGRYTINGRVLTYVIGLLLQQGIRPTKEAPDLEESTASDNESTPAQQSVQADGLCPNCGEANLGNYAVCQKCMGA
jgi:predicted RNA-binding Zn-ribbon protein involved in translation (DUF1610 family)